MELTEYYHLFGSNGFDDIDVVKLLNDSDLKALGIDKKGSRMKVMLYAKKWRRGNNTINDNANDTSLSAMRENDILEWVNSINLSAQWKEVATNAIKKGKYDGNDIKKLKSGKDVSKLLGIQNPMLCSRLWKEIKKINRCPSHQ